MTNAVASSAISTVRCAAASDSVTDTASTDWLLIAIPGAIWGASFLFIAEALNAIGPSGVTFARLSVGFATLASFPSARRAISRSDWRRITSLGVLWFAFPLSMFPFAEQRVSSALTGMLIGANPLFTAIVAAGLARRMPSPRLLRGLVVGLVGMTLVAWPALGQGTNSAQGIVLIVAAVVSYGFALNLARPLQLQYGAMPVIWRAQGVATILTAPLGVPDLFVSHWSAGPFLALLALGALGTGVAYVVLGVAAGRLGATRASASAFLIPVVALTLGVAIRGEHVAMLSVVGSAVGVVGAVLMRPTSAD
jgi:drug/metabolite transporter (DMT)-like permease